MVFGIYDSGLYKKNITPPFNFWQAFKLHKQFTLHACQSSCLCWHKPSSNFHFLFSLLDLSGSIFHLFLVSYCLNVYLFSVSDRGRSSPRCNRTTANSTLSADHWQREKSTSVGTMKQLLWPSSSIDHLLMKKKVKNGFIWVTKELQRSITNSRIMLHKFKSPMSHFQTKATQS